MMYYLNWLVSSLLLLPVVVVMMDGRKIRRNLWQSYVRLMFENTEEFRFRADARILRREKRINCSENLEKANEIARRTYQMVNDFPNPIHTNFDAMNFRHWVIVNLYFDMH